MDKDIFNKNSSLTTLVDIAEKITIYETDVNELYKESYDPLIYQEQIKRKVRDTCHTTPFLIIRREIEVNGLLSKFFAALTSMYVNNEGKLTYCSYEAYKEMMSKNTNIPILNKAEYFEIVSYVKTTYYHELKKQKTKDEEND